MGTGSPRARQLDSCQRGFGPPFGGFLIAGDRTAVDTAPSAGRRGSTRPPRTGLVRRSWAFWKALDEGESDLPPERLIMPPRRAFLGSGKGLFPYRRQPVE